MNQYIVKSGSRYTVITDRVNKVDYTVTTAMATPSWLREFCKGGYDLKKG